MRTQLTGVVIVGYTGLFVITTWQAMRGQPLVHPDAVTWTAFGATVAVTALLALLVIASARRGVQPRGRHARDSRALALPDDAQASSLTRGTSRPASRRRAAA